MVRSCMKFGLGISRLWIICVGLYGFSGKVHGAEQGESLQFNRDVRPILAAACFARSSSRLYNWILSHPSFGPLVRRFRAGKGIPQRIKIYAALAIVVFVSFAVFYAIPQHLGISRIITGIAGIIGLWYILTRPTDQGN